LSYLQLNNSNELVKIRTMYHAPNCIQIALSTLFYQKLVSIFVKYSICNERDDDVMAFAIGIDQTVRIERGRATNVMQSTLARSHARVVGIL